MTSDSSKLRSWRVGIFALTVDDAWRRKLLLVILKMVSSSIFDCCVAQLCMMNLSFFLLPWMCKQITIMYVPVPQIQQELVDVVNVISQERLWERIAEQVVGVPLSRIVEATQHLAPQEPFPERIVEQIGECVVPQVEELVKVLRMRWNRS